jgi:hypothetical protein
VNVMNDPPGSIVASSCSCDAIAAGVQPGARAGVLEHSNYKQTVDWWGYKALSEAHDGWDLELLLHFRN